MLLSWKFLSCILVVMLISKGFAPQLGSGWVELPLYSISCAAS